MKGSKDWIKAMGKVAEITDGFSWYENSQARQNVRRVANDKFFKDRHECSSIYRIFPTTGTGK